MKPDLIALLDSPDMLEEVALSLGRYYFNQSSCIVDIIDPDTNTAHCLVDADTTTAYGLTHSSMTEHKLTKEGLTV